MTRSGKKNLNVVILVFIGLVGFSLFDNWVIDDAPPEVAADLTPEWEAVAAWPGLEADVAAADPAPDRSTTVLVFDDSGSMSSEIVQAKQAALDFVAKLPPETYFGAIGLNSGVLVQPMPVDEALPALRASLRGVQADGGTPLTGALRAAHEMLRLEAANQRGFGTYQILVTTDGAANDPGLLIDEVVTILRTSPITISTIGLGIGEGHPLNLGGETRYVAIANVADLAGALQDVAAEQTVFDPITAFEEGQ